MKALVKSGKGFKGVCVNDIPEPTPKDNEVKIKVMATGICGTDIHIMQDEYPHIEPVVMGHEYVGTIVEIGKDVKNLQVNDRVISLTAAFVCGKCKYCRQGMYMMCKERKSIGSGMDGAMAEYLVVPEDIVYKVPLELDYGKELAICEPIACCVRAVLEISSIKAGDTVLISGPGTIGLLCTQLAKLNGAYVIVSGTKMDIERLKLAKEFGADAVVTDIDELRAEVIKNDKYGVDIAFECAGVMNSMSACVEMLKKQGEYIQVALFGKTIPFDFDKVLFKELVIRTSFAQEPSSWDILLKILKSKKLKLEPLTNRSYPIEEWETAVEAFKNKEAYKILLLP